jgi:hypothetical protein
MSRSSNNTRWLFLLSALTAALLWLAPARTGQAAVYTYNARQRTINAGVLFVGSAADPAFYTTNTPNPVPDPAPYLFYVLDQRADVKPVGWSFINPIAATTVSAATATRWAAGTPAYKVGDPVTPGMAAYWEVSLRDTSADELQQFDVLYLPAGGAVFLPSDNEKLRRFVDNGGQLIVEYGTAGDANHLLFTGANWMTGTDMALTPPAAPGGFDLHPLLTQPNFFAPNDFFAAINFPLLGAPAPAGIYGTIAPATNSDYSNLFGTVLNHSSLPAVSAAQLGGGQIVTSTLNIGPVVSISQGTTFQLGPFFGLASYSVTPPPVSYSPSVAPAADLKFLSNVISWADAHPTENKTSHQNAAGPSSASYTAAWSYPDPSLSPPYNQLAGVTPPPGAAVWGNYVFVTDAMGILRAFDAIPDEYLTAGASADDGVADFGDPLAPKPYDEVWHASVSASASAPTVGTYNGSTFVFVEKADGSVLQLNAITGVLVKTLTPPAPANGSAGTYPQPSVVNAPAPTYYDGRIYAGQPNGDMYIYSLNDIGSAGTNNGMTGVRIPVNPANANPNNNSSNPEYVTAAPAVGLLASGTDANTIVAYVPTSQNMNTVLLGARNDPLVGYSANGQFLGYNVNRNTRYTPFNNLFVDTASTPPAKSYDAFGNNILPVNAGQDPVFSAPAGLTDAGAYSGDWDIDFRASTGQSNNGQSNGMTLTLHEIKALSRANNTNGGATLSAPAIDRKGDYYYTVNDGTNSYLFGVHDDIQQRSVRLKFRFRLPTTGDSGVYPDPSSGLPAWNYLDADNVNYNSTTTNPNGATNNLLGFHFVGAPVVDGQGNVYVAAQNQAATVAAVLCFNANQEVTAEAETLNSSPPPVLTRNTTFEAKDATYYQADEFMGNPHNSLVSLPTPVPGAARRGQMTAAGSHESIFNFGLGSGAMRQIAGNLTEPQPFVAVPNPPSNNAAQSSSPTSMYFHTNMAWYTTFAVNGTISGLSKAGSTLFLCDSGSGRSGSYNILYKLPAAPTVGIGKLAALIVEKTPLGTGARGKPLDIGTVSAAPSAGGGAMVVNGSKGIAAFNQQLTLIADNNRILEVDADGNAVWSADATTRDTGNGVKTKVDFAHPSALAQFAPNDYLVADTGNNRCVRFDRAGNVLWELTRFYDPSGLMAPGQPMTLSQPSSVEVRRYADTDPNNPSTTNPSNPNGTKTSYLIADSGNDRIVEVTDTFDKSGNIYVDTNGNHYDHLLSWVTHTGDKYGRHYHYAGASYLDIPSGSTSVLDTIQVFALVTNTRVGAPALVSTTSAYPPVYALAAASADAPGGSIIAFNRPVARLAPKPFNVLGPNDNDLIYVATSFTAPITVNGATVTQPFPVRNPRFLHVFAPPQPMPTNPANYAYSFLYADSNGAFDLVYTGPSTPLVSYGLAFTQANYQAMSASQTAAQPLLPISADVQGNVPPRNGLGVSGSFPALLPIPFVPTCVQRLNDDETNRPGINHIERYLITQSFSQGELGTILRPAIPASGSTSAMPAIQKVGGEIFEVDVSTDSSGVVTIDPVGGFAGAVTLSRPVGTTPLTQPTFAMRTTQ